MKFEFFKIGQYTDSKKFYVGRIEDITIDESLRITVSHVIVFECLTKKEAQEYIKNYKAKAGVK